MSIVPEPQQQAKHPVTVLAGPYGHPLHPILVTVPIGAWVASLVFDVASHVTAGPGFLAQGSLWLIAVGVIGALAAACAGFLDLFAIPLGTPAFRTALVHMTLNLAVTAGYAAGFAWRYGGYHHPGPVAAGQLALSAVCLVLLGLSGFLGGKLALGTWLSRGGIRQQQTRTSRFPAPVIFGHFLLAAAGLIVWIVYLVAGSKALAWTAFVILLPVALLGFTMFFRWIAVYRGTSLGPDRPAAPSVPRAAGGAATATATAEVIPAERHLPVPVVLAHGTLAATTLVLVLLAAIGV